MAFLTALSIVMVALAVCTTAHPDSQAMFCASPETYTYTVDEDEEYLSKTFKCVAINAHKMEWIVNGSKISGHDLMESSTVHSTLHHKIPIGDSVEVVCRAWPFNRSDPYVESEPAVISVQTCNCSNQNVQSSAESQGNMAYTSPAVGYSVVAGLLGISVLLNIVLVVVVVALCSRLRRGKRDITSGRIDHDGNDDETDGPRRHKPQGGGGDGNVRKRRS